MRGGTSKGAFFRADSLPANSIHRDHLLLRIIGSPDPYGKQIDGRGGATSSTSKVVIVAKSSRPDCDVDYWFGCGSFGTAADVASEALAVHYLSRERCRPRTGTTLPSW